MARQPEWHGVHNGRRVHIPDSVIDRHRDSNVEFEWWDSAYDYIADLLSPVFDVSKGLHQENYGWEYAFTGYFATELTVDTLMLELGYKSDEAPILRKVFSEWEASGLAHYLPVKFQADCSPRCLIQTVEFETWEVEQQLTEMLEKQGAWNTPIGDVMCDIFSIELNDFDRRLTDYVSEITSLCAEIVEEEYDYLTSDEAVIEAILLKEWDIDHWVFERGKREHNKPNNHTILAA